MTRTPDCDQDFVVQRSSVDSLLQSLGERLREARLRRNMTVEQVAKMVGTSRKTIAEAERGNPATGAGIYVGIFSALGLEEQLGDLATKEREYEELRCDVNRKRARSRSSRLPP